MAKSRPGGELVRVKGKELQRRQHSLFGRSERYRFETGATGGADAEPAEELVGRHELTSSKGELGAAPLETREPRGTGHDP
jgi:hypothetical protein